MTTNQLLIRQCRYCCSDDMGLGWQHGEALKYHRVLGNRLKYLICRRCGEVLDQCVAEPRRFPQAKSR